MIDSILNSVKKGLGIEENYDVFDDELIMHINTQFSKLWSIGASPAEAFMIIGPQEPWSDFYGDIKQAQMVKTYVILNVRLIFDPPSSSFVLEAFQKQIAELEWRLSILEFVFNPASQPIYYPAENHQLAELVDQVDDIEEELEEIPDLSTIFQGNLEE